MAYFTYIIYSKSRNKYYIGSSQDPTKRLEDHNNSRSNYTRKTNDWVLKWTESFDTKTEALQKEKSIKKMKSRKYIEELIHG